MRLKMDSKGEIVQVDSRFDDDRGIGRTAPLVEDDDVAKLSAGKDRQILFDRLKAREMSRAGKREYQKQQLINSYKERLKNNLKEIATFHASRAKKMALGKKMDAQNSMKLKAIKQGAVDFESLGVSGSGLTPTGAKPFPTFPGMDWRIYESAPNDFGSMGIISGSMPSARSWVEPIKRELPPTPQPKEDLYASMKAVETPIKGGFTTFHKFIIGIWENNSYVVKQRHGDRKRDESGYVRDEKGQYVYEWNTLAPTTDTVINLQLKKRLWDQLENFRLGSRYEGQKEFLASSMRGWMWSGYFDKEGNWIQVKVPFAYGLPMDFPESPKSDEEMNDLEYFRRTENINGANYSGKVFVDLRDVIHAYAMYYKYMMDDVDFAPHLQEQRQVEVMDTTMTAAAESGDMKDIVKEVVEKKAVGAGAYFHPMLQEGLIPKRSK